MSAAEVNARQEPPALLAVEICWTDGGVPRTQLFGPWRSVPDDGHVAEIRDFLDRWRSKHGQPERIVMALLQDPRSEEIV